MPRSRTLLAPAVAALTLALVGCADAGLPMPTPTPSPTYAVTGDGVLRIGTLFESGSGFSAGQVAGVEAAVREINEAGGVNGAAVEVFHRNAGDGSAEAAGAAYADLVAKGADVVIGPSSSSTAEQLADAVAAAGVPLVSASATAASLTALDDGGLILRTVGGYSAQAAALAGALADDGAAQIAYVYLDDDNGAALLDSLTAAVDEAGLALAYSGSISATATDFSKVISAVKKAKADAVVVSTPNDDAEQTMALITALHSAKLGGSALWLTTENSLDYSTGLPGGALDGAHGLHDGALPDEAFVARLRQADPGISSVRYAAEAYDATVLAALAVVRAGDDGGPAIARVMPVVSAKGIACTSFGACLDVLHTEPDIDYNGVSGPVDLTAAGDVATAPWSFYVYGPENTLTLDRSVIAG